MKRSLQALLILVLILSSVDASAQRWKLRRYEADFYLGAVAPHGDIGVAGRPMANMFNGNRPSLGFTPRYMIQKDLAVSLDLGYLMYAGKDVAGETHNRLYKVNSQVFSHYLRLEYFIIGEPRNRTAGIYNRRGMVNNYSRIHLYILGGVGGILSNAVVREQEGGEEPLQNPGYKPGTHYGVGFPVGGGIKVALDPRWSLGVEATYNFTLTDLLDGYQSVYSDFNDTYYLFSVKAIYRVRNDRRGRPIFNKFYR